MFDDTRAMSEPSGALAVAGLKEYVARGLGAGGTLVAINSGANLNFSRLRHIAERAELGERREVLLAVTIPERPGSYRAFMEAIGPRAVSEFNYRYAAGSPAHIFVGVEVSGPSEKRELIASLRERDYPVLDLSDNEMAKVHVRYMVGGRVPGLSDERLLRFEFPERPGALMKFLDSLSDDWNISLFHYRNHGADYGRVLAGIQVPEAERARFRTALEALAYPYYDESDNPAFRLFLDGSAAAA